METIPLSIVALGCAIILALAIYAGWLLAKLHHQTKTQKMAMQDAIEQRNVKIIESVDVIALATLQEQCDLSEAAIRLYMIMTHLQGDKEINFSERFPALYELFDTVKDMPRGCARKKLPKPERMRHDMERIKAESRLEQTINNELETILIFTGARQSQQA